MKHYLLFAMLFFFCSCDPWCVINVSYRNNTDNRITVKTSSNLRIDTDETIVDINAGSKVEVYHHQLFLGRFTVDKHTAFEDVKSNFYGALVTFKSEDGKEVSFTIDNPYAANSPYDIDNYSANKSRGTEIKLTYTITDAIFEQ